MRQSDEAAHVDSTIEQLADLYDQHERSAGSAQRLANRTTLMLGRPLALAVVLLLVILWVGGNYLANWFGLPTVEKFPFSDLAFVATLAALMVALLILTTQRHEDALAEKRARLTLQIAVLSEKKIAKVIALLEEQRRDNPLLTSRIDDEANAMAGATDPRSSLEQIQQSEQRV